MSAGVNSTTECKVMFLRGIWEGGTVPAQLTQKLLRHRAGPGRGVQFFTCSPPARVLVVEFEYLMGRGTGRRLSLLGGRRAGVQHGQR